MRRGLFLACMVSRPRYTPAGCRAISNCGATQCLVPYKQKIDATRKPQREEQHEATRIPAGGGHGPGRHDDGRAGDCPVDARAEMAAHRELAEIARYALWRARAD